ncbi:hypothetical protein AG1IA_08151 [Rhizoctonia solani AG-1 IA]|uniref:Uncharacterized protein n=1 Tax=Thanatephorus cucumeris (strain AG1-IA) TaxID=983506 RepID=L8WLZ6_THACA|nr:hypothetical protein AG1IA_08151 [Rhizoctonia solani AG-1 IA]
MLPSFLFARSSQTRTSISTRVHDCTSQEGRVNTTVGAILALMSFAFLWSFDCRSARPPRRLLFGALGCQSFWTWCERIDPFPQRDGLSLSTATLGRGSPPSSPSPSSAFNSVGPIT